VGRWEKIKNKNKYGPYTNDRKKPFQETHKNFK
jgi:hypothetical protein